MLGKLRHWYRGDRPRETTTVPPHDVDHVTAMRRVLRDTYVWKRFWANWRVCFAYDDDGRVSFQGVSAFVRDEVGPRCAGEREAIAIAIYLRDQADLKAIYRSYGHVERGLGVISSIQSRAVYDHGVAIGDLLAGVVRDGGSDDRLILDMPDLVWTVSGTGIARVAVAGLRGHRLVVRAGGGSDAGTIWLVDVDHERGCAGFRSRADAMSKYGVAMALQRHRLRQIEAGKSAFG